MGGGDKFKVILLIVGCIILVLIVYAIFTGNSEFARWVQNAFNFKKNFYIVHN